MRFGRLEKRRDKAQIDQLIKVVEKMTNQKMPKVDKLKPVSYTHLTLPTKA